MGLDLTDTIEQLAHHFDWASGAEAVIFRQNSANY
jgi:hypothetical protein